MLGGSDGQSYILADLGFGAFKLEEEARGISDRSIHCKRLNEASFLYHSCFLFAPARPTIRMSKAQSKVTKDDRGTINALDHYQNRGNVKRCVPRVVVYTAE